MIRLRRPHDVARLPRWARDYITELKYRADFIEFTAAVPTELPKVMVLTWPLYGPDRLNPGDTLTLPIEEWLASMAEPLGLTPVSREVRP